MEKKICEICGKEGVYLGENRTMVKMVTAKYGTFFACKDHASGYMGYCAALRKARKEVN